jgi:hypothetical protein
MLLEIKRKQICQSDQEKFVNLEEVDYMDGEYPVNIGEEV